MKKMTADVENWGCLQRHRQYKMTVQHGTLSELLIRQPPIAKSLGSKGVSTDPAIRIEEMFVKNWSASNSNLKVRIAANCLCSWLILCSRNSELWSRTISFRGEKGCLFSRVSDRKHLAGNDFFSAKIPNDWIFMIGLLAAKVGVYCARTKDEIESVLNVSAKAWRKVSVVINSTRNKLGAGVWGTHFVHASLQYDHNCRTAPDWVTHQRNS